MNVNVCRPEDLFFVLSVVALAAVLAAFIVSGTLSSPERFTFDPQVPTEFSFSSSADSGMVRIQGNTFDSISKAIEAADSGDTLYLSGTFKGTVTVNKPGLSLVGPTDEPLPVIDGQRQGHALIISAPHTTIRHLWIRNSGMKPEQNDAGIWVGANNVQVLNNRLTRITFGIWMDGVKNVLLKNNTIVGRESVYPLSSRGNGIQIWKSETSEIINNDITDVRDGIYYSWASEVVARKNTMWNLRYGVHYMYSDHCVLRNNLSFENDSGYALMVSQNLKLIGNTAVNNHGQSGHGILLKSIDNTLLERNTLVRNGNGFYVYNSLDNTFVKNLVLSNTVGVHLTAGSVRETVHSNTFIGNGEPVRAIVGQQVKWNTEETGNFWSGARTVDVDGDGVSEISYRPSGLLEQLAVRRPLTELFSRSPSFALIRLAENSLPMFELPGVVDYHPLVKPTRRDWRQYFE